MSKINRIIPFSWWPANWGLNGERRERALAEYHWDGEDLAYRLLAIDHPSEASMDYRRAKAKLDHRYHKISEYDFGLAMIELDERHTQTERDKELARYLRRHGKISQEEMEEKILEASHDSKESDDYRRDRLKMDVKLGRKTQRQADQENLEAKYEDLSSIDYKVERAGLALKWGEINQNQHDKEVATLLREPWFNLIGADHQVKGDNTQLAVELDWNEFFIQFLESKGWTGSSPDDIVDRWFSEAMRQMLNIGEDMSIDDGESDPMPMASMSRNIRDDGLTEYR